ncbi:MAG: hypothetical protein HYU97_01135 [Deltaproteobacteria bacterium]|nr:hypothetical protein [Deltaproteobacteria bacterium]
MAGKKDAKPTKQDDLDKTLLDIDIRNLKPGEDEDADSDKTIVDMDITKFKEEMPEEESGGFSDPELTYVLEEEKKIGEVTEETNLNHFHKTQAENTDLNIVAPPIEIEAPPAPKQTTEPLAKTPPVFPWLGMALAGVFWIFSLIACLEILRKGTSLKMAVFAALGLQTFLIIGGVLRKFSNTTLWRYAGLIYLGLYYYNLLRFNSTDPQALTFFGITTERLLVVWVLLTYLFTSSLGILKRNFKLWLRVGLIAPLIVYLIPVILTIIYKSTLEDLGPFSFGIEGLPFALRPISLSLGWLPIVASMMIAMSFFVTDSQARWASFRQEFGPSLILLILLFLSGHTLLNRQGILHPLNFVYRMQVPSGSASANLTTGGPLLAVQANIKPGVQVAPLILALSEPALEKGQQVVYAMVKNSEGRDFFGLKPNQFYWKLDEQKIKPAKLLSVSRQHKTQHSLIVVNPVGLNGAHEIMIKRAIQELLTTKGLAKQILIYTPKDNTGLTSFVESALKKDAAIRSVIYVGATLDEPANALKNTVEKKKLKFASILANAVEPSQIYSSILQKLAGDFGLYRLQLETASLEPTLKILPSEDNTAIDFSLAGMQPDAAAMVLVKAGDQILKQLGYQEKYHLPLQTIPADAGPLTIELIQNEKSYLFNLPLPTFTAGKANFVNLFDKSLVSGTLNLEVGVDGQSSRSIKFVEFFLDGNKVGTASSEPFQFKWDTSSEEEGEHHLQAITNFSDGDHQTLQAIVFVSKDMPEFKLLRPNVGEYLSNVTEIEATVSGAYFNQIQKVEFYINGELIGEALQSPYRYLWDNSNYHTGNYSVQAKALLPSGQFLSTGVTVKLSQAKLSLAAQEGTSGMLYPDHILWVLDYSEFAKTPIFGGRVVDQIATLGLDAITKLPDQLSSTLITMGGGKPLTHHHCRDVSIFRTQKSDWRANLNTLFPKGERPLEFSLRQAHQILKKAKGTHRIILVTHGWDTCEGDPFAAVEGWQKQGDTTRVNVIALGSLSEKEESLLRGLAEKGKGNFYGVANLTSLEQALENATRIYFRLTDFKGKNVLEAPLSTKAYSIRAGEYRLEADLDPPLINEKFVLPNGADRQMHVLMQNGKYQFQE